MYRILFIIALLCATYGVTRAQDFNYSVSTDSVAWNELNTQTILNSNNAAWNFSYKIPIGFTFNFCGRDFDSLTIETNGYVVFDEDRNYAITAFSGIGDCVDGSSNHAVLGYELTGTAGSRILKIQYKNCGKTTSNEKTQSWQIWLRESGVIEFRIGPGTLRYNGSEADTTQKFRIGLLNMNMDTEDCGLLMEGNPSSPAAEPVSNSSEESPHLDSVPLAGYRYTFSQL